MKFSRSKYIFSLEIFILFKAIREQKSGVFLKSMEPNVFRMLFSIKNLKTFDFVRPTLSIFHRENGLFGQPKVQEAYKIIILLFLMENSIVQIFGSVDVNITPDFCS